MCLLERVLDYNERAIRCETLSHLNPANPLRRNGHLSGICGIEYAAQAMALHRALNRSDDVDPRVRASGTDTVRASAPETNRHGYLVSVRETRCDTRYLDTIDTALDVRAEYVFGDASRMVYTFVVATGETQLVSGRAAVMLG